MKVSLNLIKQYTTITTTLQELVSKINAQLGGVEEIIDVGKMYQGIVVARIVECIAHPDSDHLHICTLDDGGIAKNIERDGNGYVQVVCGAPNVHSNMFVVWLPPGCTVPASYNDTEPFVLGVRKLRGIISNGMIASARELAIGDDHDGIVELTTLDLPAHDNASRLKPGADFATLFGLNDHIIDIENKMFTHRPDCFGQLGVAREIAAITGQPFTSPDWYRAPGPEPENSHTAQASTLPLQVINNANQAVPRFMAVGVGNVTIAPSPFWLQCALVRLGSKPINNVVDVTNYVMLLTSQPLHAYDYDKLNGHMLGVRMAQPKEKIALLNGKTYSLTLDDIVIYDGNGPVGLGGIMGGGNSEVSEQTTNIVLECATFDMYAIRKTSMRHGLFTEAVTRFNKGQSPLQNPAVMSYALKLLQQLTGGRVASPVYDKISPQLPATTKEVVTTAHFINERLGLQLTDKVITDVLRNVECNVENRGSNLHIQVPFWRTDIEIPEDIVEEVGRLYGFDKLPRELPRRSIAPAPYNPHLKMKQNIRQSLSGSGANEVVTYSFVHENILTKAGQDAAQAYRLANALSPDLHYYRLSLIPSLLDKIHGNIKAGHDEFSLFEFGKAHRVGDVDEQGLPHEYGRLALVYSAKNHTKTAYYIARRYADSLQGNLTYRAMADFDMSSPNYKAFRQLAAPFEPGRSAVVLYDSTKLAGIVGEFKVAVRRAFKLPDQTAGFELFQSFLDTLTRSSYTPLARFPHVAQDISLKVPAAVAFADVYTTAQNALRNLKLHDTRCTVLARSVYQSPDKTYVKTITLRVIAVNYERTLTDTEVTKYLQAIEQAAAAAHNAQQV